MYRLEIWWRFVGKKRDCHRDVQPAAKGDEQQIVIEGHWTDVDVLFPLPPTQEEDDWYGNANRNQSWIRGKRQWGLFDTRIHIRLEANTRSNRRKQY